MADIGISTQALRAASTGMSGVIDRLDQAITTLESTVNGIGSPWGAGPVGSVFGEMYREIRELALGTYEHNSDVMSEYTEGLDVMAQTLDVYEHDAEADFELVEADLATMFPRLPANP